MQVSSAALFALCGVLAFVVNWIAFVPAYVFRTERFYDLVGSFTYLLLTCVALSMGNYGDTRSQLLALCVCIWAIRLGSFLFSRIRQDGRDPRFEAIKQSFPRFLTAWTLQAFWVFVTLSPTLAVMTSTSTRTLGTVGGIGLLIWLTGFSIEVVADRQKNVFRRHAGNRGRYITTGLWAWSRHPNYFGEILLWTGIAVVAYPALSGWQLATLISPIFVLVLITRVSGVPLLERSADERWGTEPAYQSYKRRTPVLFLKLPI